MTIKEIQTRKESQTFDCKSIQIDPKALAFPIVAMANADGGVLTIGVSDKTHRIEGIIRCSMTILFSRPQVIFPDLSVQTTSVIPTSLATPRLLSTSKPRSTSRSLARALIASATNLKQEVPPFPHST